LDKCSAAQIVDTAAAVAKLRLQPPGMWLRALTAAVNSNLGQFESGSLLEVLTALQKLQAGRRANGSSSSSSRRAGIAADKVGSSSSSSIVPFARRQVQQWSDDMSSEDGSYVSSSSSRAWPAHVVVLRSTVAREQQQQHDREAGRQLESMFGFHSSSSSPGVARSLRHQQSAVASLQELDAAAAEAYSMACLVVLMPDWLQSKVAQWPKHMAAERAALQQQQQQCGHLQISSVG
jgi:hypothetical protein